MCLIMMIVILITFLLTSKVSLSEHPHITTKSNLYKNLTSGYNRMVSPHTGEEPINISTSFHVDYIVDVDENKQMFHTLVRHRLHWIDSRLTWEPKDYDNISMINLPPQYIWTSDLMFGNSVSQSPYLTDLDKSSLVVISCLGDIYWYPTHHIETICHIDTALFPFDTQTCHVLLITNTSDDREVILTTFNQTFMQILPESNEWIIIGQESKNVDRYAEAYDLWYSSVHHSIHIHRRMTFYNLCLIIPCIIHILLPLLMFHLSADNGDRMSIGTNVWASQIVFLLLITGIIPGSSGKMPLLGIVNMCALLFISFSLSLMVLNKKWASSEIPDNCLMNIMLYLYNKRNINSETNMKTSETDSTDRMEILSTKADLKSCSDHICFVMQLIALLIMMIFLVVHYI